MRLLVSPRNIEEAKLLVNAPHVDYIDCKNPLEGSLGANFPWIIKGMKALIPKNSHQFLSATIGDFPYLPGSASLAALGAACSGADIIKVGLKGPRNEEQGIHLMKNVVKSVKEYNKKIQVVAAGYADNVRMGSSPGYLEIPKIAAKSGADIAMLDTYIKDGKGLFDFLNEEELMSFTDQARELNIKVALAGNLMEQDLEKIKKIKPDIIGVRSIVCENYDRTKSIKLKLIENLQIELFG
ncbi:MAG: (5-formylfuran-3-yl)methyl phosphate synthase [Promethearchaeota archaeon]